MKHLRKSIPVILILLTGCTTATLLMKVDPSLETNASVYEVESPDSWSDKKLNVSFGPYRVADMDAGWRRTGDSPSTGSFWADMLADILSETTGLSTSINTPDGTTSDDTTSDDTTSEFSEQSLTYKFKVGNEITWDSRCDHIAEKQETRYRQASSIRILESRYTCRHTRAGDEQWVLSVQQQDSSGLDIRMASKEKVFTAHSTAGTYRMSDGSPPKLLRPADVGYTWTHDNDTVAVAAISLNEKIPRVWLDKRNPDSVNHALSMASAGLLIYHRKIAPTLKEPIGER
jgi:hypothetical protein